jgi:hypothetical protein
VEIRPTADGWRAGVPKARLVRGLREPSETA